MNLYALDLARIPNTSLKILLRLAKTLLSKDLSASSDALELATKELLDYVEVVSAALIARVTGNNPAVVATEVEFDLAVDALWMQLMRRLDDATAYTHPGLDLLSPPRAESAGLAKSRAQAERARELLARVFGSGKIAELIKTSFIEQAESTATLMRMIDEQGMREDFEAIAGVPLMRTLDSCQAQYEEMVDARLDRQQGMTLDHRELRQTLRQRLAAYANAVLLLARPGQPETAELVVAHLRPILTLRELFARAGGNEREIEAELEDFEELELPGDGQALPDDAQDQAEDADAAE